MQKLNFKNPLRVKAGGQRVTLIDPLFRSRGRGRVNLCVMDQGDHEETILVDDHGKILGHSSYTTVENVALIQYFDVHTDGSISPYRNVQERGMAPSFVEQKEVHATFSINTSTLEISDVLATS